MPVKEKNFPGDIKAGHKAHSSSLRGQESRGFIPENKVS